MIDLRPAMCSRAWGPTACFYSDDLSGAAFPEAPAPGKYGLTCIFSQLAPVRRGEARAFNQDNLGC